MLPEKGVLNACEVTLEFFRKYLGMPKGTLEELCQEVIRLKSQPQVSEEELRQALTKIGNIAGGPVADYAPNFAIIEYQKRELRIYQIVQKALSRLYKGEDKPAEVKEECPSCHLKNIIFGFHKLPMNCQFCGATLVKKELKPAEKVGVPEEIDLSKVDKHDTLKLAETINALIRVMKAREK